MMNTKTWPEVEPLEAQLREVQRRIDEAQRLGRDLRGEDVATVSRLQQAILSHVIEDDDWYLHQYRPRTEGGLDRTYKEIAQLTGETTLIVTRRITGAGVPSKPRKARRGMQGTLKLARIPALKRELLDLKDKLRPGTINEIAEREGVSRQTLHSLATGKTYSYIAPAPPSPQAA